MPEFELLSRLGTVAEVQVWAENKIYSSVSGGSGYISQGSGYISPVSLKLTNVVKQRGRAFVKWDDGTETEIPLSEDFTARAGHRILDRRLEFDGKIWPVSYTNLDLNRAYMFEYQRPGGMSFAGKLAIFGAVAGVAATIVLGQPLGWPLAIVITPVAALLGALIMLVAARVFPANGRDTARRDFLLSVYRMIKVAAAEPLPTAMTVSSQQP